MLKEFEYKPQDMNNNQSCDKISNGEKNEGDVNRPEEVSTALFLHLDISHKVSCNGFIFIWLHLDDSQLLLGASHRRDWLTVQGESSPTSKGHFTFILSGLKSKTPQIILG